MRAPAGPDDPVAASTDRLDSWKEIARYLGRSVLTAQRWEKAEGLPVRRHAHEKQASVYAYRAELDRWRRERSVGEPARVRSRWTRATTSLARASHWRPPAPTRRVAIGGVSLLVALVALTGWQVRTARVRRARQQAIPAIQRELGQTLTSERVLRAYRLVEEARRSLPDDPWLATTWSDIGRPIEIISEPSGVHVSMTAYGGSDTLDLGTTPIRGIRMPRTVMRWRAERSGYVPAEGLIEPGRDTLGIHLERVGAAPERMVRAGGGTFGFDMAHLGEQASFVVGDFWIDRYEVTNREYKRFVDAGGYTNARYWKEPFEEDGHRLSHTAAMARFRDRTGRPGPATWDAGDFPEGKGDDPVTGVSWFEAMAYAEFVGKSLPTIFQWVRAAGLSANAEIIPRSNFSGRALAAVGHFPAISAVGAFDMAGNAKEWCLNATAEGRFVLGGAWNEPTYMFNEPDGQPPFVRADNIGFRLVRNLSATPPAQLAAVEYPRRDFEKERPVSDAVFASMRRRYDYPALPLHASIDSVDDSDEHWRREMVSFDAAYGGERMFAILYLPRHAQPPYQTVVYFPGSGVIEQRSSRDLRPPLRGAAVKSGRAMIYPIYKGTFERGDSLSTDYPAATEFYRRHVVAWYQDLERTLDYVATRRDLDASRTAYLGFSWGARLAPIFLALEPRLKTAVLLSGGLKFARTLPEVDPFNFAPRVMVPVLMLNGRYDYFFPVETSQEPLFRLLGTPRAAKRHVVVESGHVTPFAPVAREMLDWLDRYLGPVTTAADAAHGT